MTKPVPPPAGEPPAVLLCNPKFPHNVGAALRACACWGLTQLWWTGDRVSLDVARGERLPREERTRGYRHVRMCPDPAGRVFDRFPGAVPVAVELAKGATSLVDFDHPEHALYVFGPEDGSIPGAARPHCHRFVFIPTAHCLNLAAAVNVVLFHRRLQRIAAGLEEALPMAQTLREHRGPVWAGRRAAPTPAERSPDPMAITMQLNAPALERLIGGDTQVEVELREQIVEAFCRNRLKALVNHETLSKLYVSWKTELLAEISRLIQEYEAEKARADPVAPPAGGWEVRTFVDSVVKDRVGPAVGKAIQPHLDVLAVRVRRDVHAVIETEVKTAVQQAVAAAVQAQTGARLQELVDAEVGRRLEIAQKLAKEFAAVERT